MKYNKTVQGIFISRPNRFIAHVLVNGKKQICHVKNTGRCRELLIEGVTVILEENDSPSRITKYDLIAVYKGETLINIDSMAPNKVIGEWIECSGIFGTVSRIKPETKYGNSKFDFYVESGEKKAFIEVKGVTLENDGIAMFPDAPTERGTKHLKELIRAKKDGFDCFVVFVIQMSGCKKFLPNAQTDPVFASQLLYAAQNGVKIIAVDCKVYENELFVGESIKADY